MRCQRKNRCRKKWRCIVIVQSFACSFVLFLLSVCATFWLRSKHEVTLSFWPELKHKAEINSRIILRLYILPPTTLGQTTKRRTVVCSAFVLNILFLIPMLLMCSELVSFCWSRDYGQFGENCLECFRTHLGFSSTYVLEQLILCVPTHSYAQGLFKDSVILY